MGRGVEFEGRIYCDWRINVSGCVDDYFFYGAAVFQFSCILTTLILQIITCSFRYFVLKDKFSSFRNGSNLGIASFTLVNIVLTAYFGCLAFGNNQLVNGVLWSFFFPLGIVPHTAICISLTKTIAGYKSTDYKKWIPSHPIIPKLIPAFWFYLAIPNIVLLSVSEYHNSIGDLEKANTLFIVALSLLSVNFIVVLCYHLYCSFLFLKITESQLKNSPEKKDNVHSHSVVDITIFKVKQNIRSIFFTVLFSLIIFLSLIIDPVIFIHVSASKGICAVSCIIVGTAVPLTMLHIGVDIKKYKKRLSRQQSSGNLTKKPSAIDLRRQGSEPQISIDIVEVQDREM